MKRKNKMKTHCNEEVQPSAAEIMKQESVRNKQEFPHDPHVALLLSGYFTEREMESILAFFMN